MSDLSPVTAARVAFASEPADAMLRRMFKAAEILSTATCSQDLEEKATENRAKNRRRSELQYADSVRIED